MCILHIWYCNRILDLSLARNIFTCYTIPKELKCSLSIGHIYSWPWPILKVKVKVMHILAVNISQMVTDRAYIAIANK